MATCKIGAEFPRLYGVLYPYAPFGEYNGVKLVGRAADET
jgi:hypothetical protein